MCVKICKSCLWENDFILQYSFEGMFSELIKYHNMPQQSMDTGVPLSFVDFEELGKEVYYVLS